MRTVYVYVLDTLADWELGYVTAELHSSRFFKKDAERISLKTVSCSKDLVITMGGLKVAVDCLVDDINVGNASVLLLPGADTWSDPKHGAIIKKAKELLAVGATVCAICGSTVALADAGVLDERRHTSNGPGFLEMVSPSYKGQALYVDQGSVTDGNLVTAGSTASLLWAKQIIELLGVFEENTLEAWFSYFSTGEPSHFFALMQTLQSGNES